VIDYSLARTEASYTILQIFTLIRSLVFIQEVGELAHIFRQILIHVIDQKLVAVFSLQRPEFNPQGVHVVIMVGE
jgi:S-adenosylmethionine/arginine decarboxylase-like enzyme